ncbi:hypothetical protein BGZ73_008007 [Actinomortierella ambigua]|nr:hypothetical protein BGZ73_008007 [Actinomortierella ambigua]
MIKTMRDDSDPFNKFWEAVENLVQKISSPVAFATIPLDSDEPTPPPAANLTNQQQQQPSQPEKPVPFVSSQLQTPAQTWGDAPFAVAAEGPKQPSSSSASKVHSQEPPCHQQQPPRQENLMLPQQKRHVTTSKRESDLESDMVDSYFIIDSPSAPVRNATLRSRSGSANTSADTSQSVGENSQRSRKTIEEYQIENQQLKQALDRLSKRNQELEKSAQAAMQLKTNMNTWKQEVERRAMQLKQSQDMLRSVTMGRHTGQIRSADSSALLLKRPQESHTPPLLEPQTGAARQGEMPEAPTTGLGGANGGSVANTLGESNSGSAGSTQPTAYELANPMTMQRRLMELTSELEALKLENTRQTALMRKYKQRWEDLKEAAKRRRSGVKTEEGLGSESPSHKHANGNPGRAIYEENLSNQPQGPHSSTSNSRRHPPPQSVGSPFPNTVMMASSVPRGPQHSGGSPSSPLRPPTGLARSSSASGPNLHPGGTYQRRIIMETNKGGLALEHMNTYRNNHAPLSTRSPSAGKGRAHGQGQEHGLPPTVIAATAISPSASAKPKDPSL